MKPWCAVPGCTRNMRYRGVCQLHYDRILGHYGGWESLTQYLLPSKHQGDHGSRYKTPADNYAWYCTCPPTLYLPGPYGSCGRCYRKPRDA